MNRGDVVLVQLPPPDPNNPSHVQAGSRPAVVLQSDQWRNPSSVLIVVPMTANMEATRFSGSVLIHPDTSNGLRNRSVALTTQLRAVDVSLIVQTIGSLRQSDLQSIEISVRQLLGL